MAPEFADLEARALQLSAKERALLAERLIASIETPDDAEVERLWVDEALRRSKEYTAGLVSARPAEDVLRDARAAIK